MGVVMITAPASLGEGTGRVMLLIGWIILVLVLVMVIGTALYMQITTGAIPETIKEWGGICLGFILGALFSLLKERT